ncbi:MAG: hypothetical protein ACR2J3_13875 [Aridibacter sp.]
MKNLKVKGDFNGVWSDEQSVILCLSHSETCRDEIGNEVILQEGMELTAFDEDADENNKRDDLIANGIVEPSPAWLECKGSKWILRVDENGIHHESEAT